MFYLWITGSQRVNRYGREHRHTQMTLLYRNVQFPTGYHIFKAPHLVWHLWTDVFL